MITTTFNEHPEAAGRGARRGRRGFSLIEVVVAVGIFAVSISIVIGLLVPTVKSLNDTIDTNTANRLTSAINVKLAQLGYAKVQALLYPASTTPNTVSVTDTNLLFASKTGEQVGTATDNIWGGANNNAAKYYEIMLIRTPNAVLSPVDGNPANSNSSFVVFTVRMTWPAYLPDGTSPTLTKNTPSDRNTRSVFLFNAAVAR